MRFTSFSTSYGTCCGTCRPVRSSSRRSRGIAMKNVMLGFNAGDTFIHCFRGANGFLFAYGLVKAIDDAGRYHSDYQTSSPLRPGNVGPDDHLVTKISE